MTKDKHQSADVDACMVENKVQDVGMALDKHEYANVAKDRLQIVNVVGDKV